jgi:hypothetical protein
MDIKERLMQKRAAKVGETESLYRILKSRACISMASPYRLIEHESKPRLQAVRCRNATSTTPLPWMRCPKAALSNKAKRRCPPESKGGKEKKKEKHQAAHDKKKRRSGQKARRCRSMDPQKEAQHKAGKLYYVRSSAQSNTSVVFQAVTRPQARFKSTIRARPARRGRGGPGLER